MNVPLAPELPLPAGAKPAPPASAPARPAAGKGHAKGAPRDVQKSAASGVQCLRSAAVTTAARVGLAALEQATVSGKGAKLRKAIRRLPPGLVRGTRGSAGAAGLEEEETAPEAAASRSDAPAAERQTQTASATRDAGQPTTARLDLPLPDGGEARVAVEVEEGGDAARAYRVDVELDLERLGSIGVHLVADETQLLCRVECNDPEARAQLDDALTALREQLAAATGKSVGVSLDRPRADAPRLEPLGGGLDAYA
jgi:hypothetical protein